MIELERHRRIMADSWGIDGAAGHGLCVVSGTHRLRHRLWPHTSNPHVLVTHVTAVRTVPVSRFFLHWNLDLQDLPLDHRRADRVLHEALAADADPLHLAAAFELNVQTVIEYADVARALVARLIEEHPLDAGR